MARQFALYAAGLLVVMAGMVITPLPASATQNGFGDVMTATSYFPIRNLAAFGMDEDGALVASAQTDMNDAVGAAALNAIVPAAGDAKSAARHEPYGPFQPGQAAVQDAPNKAAQ
jgi:hypothetical protein